MGHNIDFVELMGLPRTVRCPFCKEKTDAMLDDYDIECGDPVNAKDGKMIFSVNCVECENDFIVLVPVGKEKVIKP